MKEEFKTVASFCDAMSAHITAGMLNENGIPAGVFGDNSSYISLNCVNPVEVKVNAADYDAAMELLARQGEDAMNETEEGQQESQD